MVESRNNILIKLGQRIKTARKNLGWSQEEFAFHCGLDRSYIGGIERGERNITFITLCKIGQALEIDVSNLIKNMPVEKK